MIVLKTNYMSLNYADIDADNYFKDFYFSGPTNFFSKNPTSDTFNFPATVFKIFKFL